MVNDFQWEIMERRKLSIFPVVLLMQTYTCEMKNLVDCNVKHFLMDYKQGSLTAIRDKEDWLRISKKVFNYVKDNPDCLDNILKNLKLKVLELSKHADLMFDYKGAVDSNAAILLFNKYCDLYVKSSVFGECIPFTIKEVLANELLATFSHYKNGYDLSSVLSTPNYLTYTMREEIDFYDRLLAYKKIPDKKEKIIKEHFNDYAWFTYDYNSSEWSEKDIENKFEKAKLINESEIKNKLYELKNYTKFAAEQSEKYIKDYKIDEYAIFLTNVLKASIILMDLKKEEYTKIHYKTRKFFLRLAEFLGLDEKYIYYIIPYEYSSIVKSKDPNILLERYNSSTVYLSKKGWNLVQNFDLNKLLDGAKSENTGHVKGMCAYPGNVKGKVEIVRSVEDVAKFSEGSILLTTMTTIDFIEAIKKAKAVITDDGGVICHAAIVCREMKKPCVVGTKNATHQFKDGDMVIVDSTNGTISKDDSK